MKQIITQFIAHFGRNELNATNVAAAVDAIRRMCERRNLVLVGEPAAMPGAFPSNNARKRFRKRMRGVMRRPTMRRANALLRDLGAKVDYTEKEKAIRAKRKAYVQAREACRKALAEYKEEKGDFYR